jgi:hypothetical protein
MNNSSKYIYFLIFILAIRIQAALPTVGDLSRHFSGGVSQYPSSLNTIKIETLKNSNTERLAFLVGDSQGKPMQGAPTFYQIALKNGELNIILSQTLRSQFTPDEFRKIIASSRVFATSELISDPQDGSLIVRLKTKRNIQNIRVYEVPGVGRKSFPQILVDLIL